MTFSLVIWVSSLLTIAAFSYLYKENEFYRAMEHLYVGVAAGYTMVMGYQNVINKAWDPFIKKGQVSAIVPALIGLLFFAPFVAKRYGWLRRYPIAVVVGIGAALHARSSVVQELVVQVRSTMISLTTIDNIIVTFGVLTVLCYFFFTFRENPVTKTGAEIGKWVLMITFGAAFGNGIMGRISLLIGRLMLLFRDWIPIIKGS
ncbi:MAG: hypothetical protein Q8P50_16645 [Bacillota bacterium]|jgi:hypothetical protein|nr:hypothetical protein [Bacillota bacterium]